MRLKLIYNPAAGKGRAQERIRDIEQNLRAFGADVATYASRSPEDLTREAAESSRDVFDRVVICGGDGTLNLALRRFDLARGTMALIPTGSGDDFARVNGIPRDIRRACEVAAGGTVREIDIATANDLRYGCIAGVGFDSEVNRYANEKVKHLRGTAVYLYAIFRILPSFRSFPMRIDGRGEEVMFAVFANCPQYGSGIRIAPEAKIDDGLLDSCIVHRTSRLQLLMTLPLAYAGKHTRKSFVEMRRAREFRVETDTPMDVFADGEPLTKTPVRFAMAAEKLRLVV
ncbi:MAG TPA: diacylglycerol kinase family protein [Thermoanaerobaculia bacterium]|nr:diacylglycerol kinase family protein [Thermoanaerobaculia bacterium]